MKKQNLSQIVGNIKNGLKYIGKKLKDGAKYVTIGAGASAAILSLNACAKLPQESPIYPQEIKQVVDTKKPEITKIGYNERGELEIDVIDKSEATPTKDGYIIVTQDGSKVIFPLYHKDYTKKDDIFMMNRKISLNPSVDKLYESGLGVEVVDWHGNSTTQHVDGEEILENETLAHVDMKRWDIEDFTSFTPLSLVFKNASNTTIEDIVDKELNRMRITDKVVITNPETRGYYNIGAVFDVTYTPNGDKIKIVNLEKKWGNEFSYDDGKLMMSVNKDMLFYSDLKQFLDNKSIEYIEDEKSLKVNYEQFMKEVGKVIHSDNEDDNYLSKDSPWKFSNREISIGIYAPYPENDLIDGDYKNLMFFKAFEGSTEYLPVTDGTSEKTSDIIFNFTKPFEINTEKETQKGDFTVRFVPGREYVKLLLPEEDEDGDIIVYKDEKPVGEKKELGDNVPVFYDFNINIDNKHLGVYPSKRVVSSEYKEDLPQERFLVQLPNWNYRDAKTLKEAIVEGVHYNEGSEEHDLLDLTGRLKLYEILKNTTDEARNINSNTLRSELEKLLMGEENNLINLYK